MSKQTIMNEDELRAYADSVNAPQGSSLDREIVIPDNAVSPRGKEERESEAEERQQNAVGSRSNIEELRAKANAALAGYNSTTNEQLREERAHASVDRAREAGLTKFPMPIADLPTKGMFYPIGTRIFLTCASFKDIKRWSGMDETSTDDINAKVQDILESCVTISYPSTDGRRGNYKDLVDVDRLYVLFGVHDQTFEPGKNDIMVKLDEKSDVRLTKNNVKFVEFPENLMKYYNEEKRCFSFPVKNTKAFAKTDGKMDIYLPTIGVSQFLMDYMNVCEQRGDNYDKDMIIYANLLIKDWRGLDINKYYDLIEWTREWGIYEWTLISKVKDIIVNATMTPTMSYVDEGGVTHDTQLTFRRGIKGIFLPELDIDL